MFLTCYSFGNFRKPKLRPTFAEIIATLRPMQMAITSSQVPIPNASQSSGQVMMRPTRAAAEEPAG